MPKKLRYFIRSEGPDRDAVKKALEWLLQMSVARGYIAVPGLKNLEGVVGEELGPGPVTDLKSKGQTLISSKEISVVTKLRPLRSAGNAPVVAFYPYGQFLDSVDSIHNVMALLIVPWRMHEIEEWVGTWNAKELGSRKPKEKREPLRSRVVEEALRDLSKRIGKATGIERPMDRLIAAQAFGILKASGEPFEPREVKAWMISGAGWKATEARELADLARNVLDGLPVGEGEPAWPSGILAIWRTRSASDKVSRSR